MASESGKSSGGVGFCGLLTVLFVGLKLGRVIDWNWWWVVSPLWLPVTVVATGFAIYLAVAIVHDSIRFREQRKFGQVWKVKLEKRADHTEGSTRP